MELILSYLVIVLSDIWHKGKLVAEGTPLEVTRAERAGMLPATARDATAEEIERYRGGAAQGNDDAGAGLSEAKAEFDALAEQHSTLLEEVDALELKKQVVTGELEALESGKETLASELEALEVSKKALAEQVTALEAKKTAASKAAK
jgi:chromosome segregation ATPase